MYKNVPMKADGIFNRLSCDETSINFACVCERFASAMLAERAVVGVIEGPSGDTIAEAILSHQEPGDLSVLWSKYRCLPELGGWLSAFLAVAEDFPASIVLTDMSTPGNRMIYVNRYFEAATGYSKEEALGRNCRFLQGPETEPEAIESIRQSIREGKDALVIVTNYRKDGAPFRNLLAIRPVHDSTGVFRFCVGVQCALSHRSRRHRPQRQQPPHLRHSRNHPVTWSAPPYRHLGR